MKSASSLRSNILHNSLRVIEGAQQWLSSDGVRGVFQEMINQEESAYLNVADIDPIRNFVHRALSMKLRVCKSLLMHLYQ